tara:strand:+ start:640 stop:1014 length:375 start_codon:yes stop_codon:yes gene_type:complete
MAASKSFIEYGPECEFPIENIPFGCFLRKGSSTPHIGTAIGDQVLDLHTLASHNVFDGPELKKSPTVFLQPTLNEFMSLGRPAWKEARATIQKLLSASVSTLRDNEKLRGEALVPQSEVQVRFR